MPRRPLLLILLASSCLGACAGGPASATVCERLAAAPANAAARIQIVGDDILSIATPIPEAVLPRAVRTTFDAIAPDGVTVFVGRERGPRGNGYRLEKRYAATAADPAGAHTRSVLAADDGRVLERSHSIPIPKVPQHVLAAALHSGTSVEAAHIVSGPQREEHWRILVRRRSGEQFVVMCDLDGTERQRWRRSEARIDAATTIR